ncbi:MAG TPA: hypothetical protein VGF30_02365 [Bacteroidia bacterium]
MKTIKLNILAIGVTMLMGFASCTNHDREMQLEQEKQKIIQAYNNDQKSRDSIENLYIATLDEIDKNLDMIRTREGIIVLGAKTAADKGIYKKDQIVGGISAINTLLAENKEKLAKLEKSLAFYKNGKKELLKSIEQAKERIVVQEAEIDELKKLLADQQYQIAELNQKLDAKTMEATDLTTQNASLHKEMKKVYFASGTYKKLKEDNILVKEGGVLGLGKVKKLNAPVDKNKFAVLDQNENTVLPISGKHPKLITNHPFGSYTLTESSNEMAQLVINDPESFWSSSKYLVVEVR